MPKRQSLTFLVYALFYDIALFNGLIPVCRWFIHLSMRITIGTPVSSSYTCYLTPWPKAVFSYNMGPVSFNLVIISV